MAITGNNENSLDPKTEDRTDELPPIIDRESGLLQSLYGELETQRNILLLRDDVDNFREITIEDRIRTEDISAEFPRPIGTVLQPETSNSMVGSRIVFKPLGLEIISGNYSKDRSNGSASQDSSFVYFFDRPLPVNDEIQLHGIAGVGDGMSGARNGSYASLHLSRSVLTVMKNLPENPLSSMVGTDGTINPIPQLINRIIRTTEYFALPDSYTTCAATIIYTVGGETYAAPFNVADSAVLLEDGDQIIRLTTQLDNLHPEKLQSYMDEYQDFSQLYRVISENGDHNLLEEFEGIVKDCVLSPKERIRMASAGNPVEKILLLKNKLLTSISQSTHCIPHIYPPVKLTEGKDVIICTDGVTGPCSNSLLRIQLLDLNIENNKQGVTEFLQSIRNFQKDNNRNATPDDISFVRIRKGQ